MSWDGCYLKNWWQSYWSKLGHEDKGSIANDEATLLAERLEFFVPKLIHLWSPWQGILYGFCWAVFLTILARYSLFTWQEVLQRLSINIIYTVLTVLSGVLISDYFRPVLKRLSQFAASWRLVATLSLCGGIAKVITMLIEMGLGWSTYSSTQLIVEMLISGLVTGGFAFVFLVYFARQYRDIKTLKAAFDKELAVQNNLIKARIAPHFFFNTINTLVSLVESDPNKASELLHHVSALFRASFNDLKEVSFEEELALCQHYLAIESFRLAGKLQVDWQVPDDDTVYDMVITALTLQSVIEQMLLNVVEMTTEMIHMSVNVTWHQHQVNIKVVVTLPTKTLFTKQDLRRQISFNTQTQRLQRNFGPSAYINSQITHQHIATTINYPLHDAGLLEEDL
jgi:two-component system sensor histidine kinase AlgZ